MSGASVTVLVLNGRRQTVKCTPNTTILQILEEVCRKQGLKPEEFDIKHHNKVLDTTQTFRFSGLPNNASLELAPAVKNRIESDITLAINLENGNRVMDSFTPNDTLLNILNKVCPEVVSDDKNPVVIYTRREIYGKELENCTLRSLGLTGGRAMIRVINRSPEMLKNQANVSVPLPSKPVEEKPYVRKFQPVQSENKKEEKTSKQVEEIKMDDSEEKVIKPERNLQKTNLDLIKLAREKRKSTDANVPFHDEKKKAAKHVVEESVKTTRKNIESMDVDATQYTSKQTKNIEEEFIFLGDRNAMLFSLESANSVPTEDLPDDFFELTIDDAKKILRDVKKKRAEMENAPLKTSEYRNLEESKKQLRHLNKYKKAIIRVQFPNRTVLQGIFSPVDTIGDVVKFVREYLEDRNLRFHLYSTPPKVVLDENSRLLELGFVPGAVVYIGTDQDKKDGFLRKELNTKFTTNSVASLAAAKMRRENTRNVNEDDSEDEHYMELNDDNQSQCSSATNEGASTSTGYAYERKVIKSSENVPKWFKPV